MGPGVPSSLNEFQNYCSKTCDNQHDSIHRKFLQACMRENPDDRGNCERGNGFHAGKIERRAPVSADVALNQKTSKRRSRADTKFKYSTEIPHAS